MSDQSAGGPSSTPPGWYPDSQGGRRWWDGSAWTAHTMPTPPQQPAQQQGQAQYGEGGYGQGGYGQPGQQRAGRVSGKLLAIIGGAVAALIVIIVLLVVLLGGGSRPTSVVEDYIDALESGDCDKIEDYVVEDIVDSEVEECETADQARDEGQGDTEFDIDIEVEDEEVDGDRATVDVKVTGTAFGEAIDETQQVGLVEQGDKWLIESFS